MTFAVYTRPLNDAGAKPEKVSEFPDYNSALEGATKHHLDELYKLYYLDADNQGLYERWMEEGNEFYIEPDTAAMKFSVLDCGPLFMLGVTGDTTLPLLYRVTCIDALAFPSGGISQSKSWKLYVKAPATYAKAEHLIKRAVDLIYKDMSYTAMNADGSSYILQQCNIQPIDAEQFATETNQPNVPVYAVQRDGRLIEQAHFLRV